ncbi:MAG TPA: SAM-dependent methyltransferase [Verrucomicrobiae bacterium]|nr:SAM-dependent methyltransferase [Verrucomicrobiae bacterium]
MTQENRLSQIIAERIRRQGRITFEEYMRAALYEPGLGYYTSPGRKVGAAGDFYTSINVHAAFGRLIAREICRMWENLGSPTAFTVAEAGAGHGGLARDVLEGIERHAPELYRGLTYVFVEIEPSLREVQASTIGRHAGRAAWRSPEEFGTPGFRFTGVLLSNELIDSFPVHLVQMTAEGLREVYVTLGEGDLAEELGTPSTPELQEYLDRLGVSLFQGQRAEINLAARRWLQNAAGSLQRGFVITIDYGYTAYDLFTPMRRTGTLLCYHRHQVVENPYLRPGEQDITTHIDFTTLMQRGEEAGLATVWFGEQYRFLLAAGLMEEMAVMEQEASSEQERLKNRLLLKKLVLPDGGMGDTFKVLVQAKGVEKPQLLCMRDWGSDL